MVKNQSGQLDHGHNINNPSFSHNIKSKCDGYLKSYNTTAIGWALVELGCGRKKSKDKLDNSAGVEFFFKIGEKVKKGDPVFKCFGSNESRLKKAVDLIEKTFYLSDKKVKRPKLII